jgi:hypothetical protein
MQYLWNETKEDKDFWKKVAYKMRINPSPFNSGEK